MSLSGKLSTGAERLRERRFVVKYLYRGARSDANEVGEIQATERLTCAYCERVQGRRGPVEGGTGHAHWAFKSMRALPAAQASTATVFDFMFFLLFRKIKAYSLHVHRLQLDGECMTFLFFRRESRRESRREKT